MSRPASPMYPNEHTSQQLTVEEMRAAIESFSDLARSLVGVGFVEARYGWGCRLHMDLCYVPMKVGTRWIDRFIRDSLEQRIVVPCESNFAFSVGGEALEVLFCHEADIHVGGADVQLLQRFLALKPFASVGVVLVPSGQPPRT